MGAEVAALEAGAAVKLPRCRGQATGGVGVSARGGTVPAKSSGAEERADEEGGGFPRLLRASVLKGREVTAAPAGV